MNMMYVFLLISQNKLSSTIWIIPDSPANVFIFFPRLAGPTLIHSYFWKTVHIFTHLKCTEHIEAHFEVCKHLK